MDVIYTAFKSIFPVDLSTVVLCVALALSLILLELWWHSWRSGRAFCFLMPRTFRSRPRQELVWRTKFGEEAMPQVDKVLTIVCECFLFNRDHRYQLSPDDQILDVYRRCHLPRWLSWLDSDAGEIDSLLERLGNDFGFDRSRWSERLTVGEIVRISQQGGHLTPTFRKSRR